MKRRVLLALAVMLAAAQTSASGELSSRWLRTAQNESAASDCQSECKTKFENCKTDCYNKPEYTVDHKEQCTRVCDQTFNFICVRHCN